MRRMAALGQWPRSGAGGGVACAPLRAPPTDAAAAVASARGAAAAAASTTTAKQQQKKSAAGPSPPPPPPATLTGFRIAPDELERMRRQRGCTTDELLLSLLGPASRLARPPISKYHVGAVGLASSGAAYVGVNLEFAGAPLSQSVHGEQFLAANLLLHGERGLDTLAVSAAPCGHCRQFYSELVCADSVRFLFGAHGAAAPEEYSLRQLLPARFGPLDLLDLENSPVPLLLEQQSNRLEWAPGALKALERRAGDAAFQKAAAAALGAARGSYSPYTRCPSGVALVAAGGRVFAGGYVENAAHNPGLAPAQAAVVSAVVGAVGGYEEVEEAVVAELPKGLVQQFGVARAVLRAATGKRALPVTRLPVRWAR